MIEQTDSLKKTAKKTIPPEKLTEYYEKGIEWQEKKEIKINKYRDLSTKYALEEYTFKPKINPVKVVRVKEPNNIRNYYDYKERRKKAQTQNNITENAIFVRK